MQANLINNYINNEKSKTTSFSATPKKSQSNERFGTLSNRTYIKPLEGKGHLIHNDFFEMPAVIAKDFAYDLKSLGKGLKGDSNDHQLGKLNDLGMKIGGLAVAGYLFTKKSTPMTKAMEFVGFGAFFSSMALWPKIALQAPAKLIHGINVQQKYEDSMGRKKSFYQDPQFIPWDLYSDKQIEKIGNRLGVDKDMPNRRAFTQEKMKKIALQNNTMWMLTAGFATPIMSALICNQAEKFVLEQQDKIKNAHANEMLEKLDEYAAKQSTSEDYLLSKQQLDGFFEMNREQPMTKNLVSELTEIISPRLDPLTKTTVEADLSKMFLNKPASLTDDIADTIVKGVGEIFSEAGMDKEISEKIIPSREEILEIFKGVGGKKATEGLNASELFDVRTNIVNSVYDKASKVENFDIDDFETATNKVFEHIHESLNKNNTATVTAENTAKIKEIAKTINEHSTKVSVLKEYSRTKVADAPETVLANCWNDVSGKLFKTLNISQKEAKNTRYDIDLVQNLFKEKMELLASSPDEVRSAKIKELSAIISKIDEKIKPEYIEKYHKTTTAIFDKSATDLGNLGLGETAQKLTAYNVGGDGSLKRLQHVFFDERLKGVKAAWLRFLACAELETRVAKGNFGDNFNGPLNKFMKVESKFERIELARQMLRQGHSSDYAIKFHFNRNPNPSTATGEIKVEKGQLYTEVADSTGKMVKKFYKYIPGQGVDIPGDSNFFKDSMRFMYENPMDEEFEKSLDKNVLNDLRNYRKEVFEKIGDANYDFKPGHRTKGGYIGKATSDEKFILTGLAGDENLEKVLKNAFHTNKWLKTFGYAGIALTAVTVVSQFFLGKMNNPQKVKKG